MGDEQQRSFVLAQGALQFLFRLDIEMIRRLIEHEQVDRLLDDLREPHACRLAAGECEHLCRDVLIGQPAGSERRANLEVRAAGICLPELLQRGILIPRRTLLLEITDGNKVPALHRAGDRRLHAEQCLEQRRFSQSVRAADGDLPAALYADVYGRRQRRIVAEHQSFRLEHEPRWRPVHIEMEVRLRPLRALREDLHLVKALLATVRHAARRNARLVALDEILLARNLRLLALVSRCLLPALERCHFLEMLITSRIARELQILDMPDDIRDCIEERDVMRDEDERVLIVLQIRREPGNMLGIKIIRRLIEDQDVRIF